MVAAGELLDTVGALALLKPADDLENLEVNAGCFVTTLPKHPNSLMASGATAAAEHRDGA